MTRTITEILKDADKAKTLNELIALWNEFAINKYDYFLFELSFANEHIRNLALKSEGCDLEKGKFYYALKQQEENA